MKEGVTWAWVGNHWKLGEELVMHSSLELSGGS